jgi:hypothetical protein
LRLDTLLKLQLINIENNIYTLQPLINPNLYYVPFRYDIIVSDTFVFDNYDQILSYININLLIVIKPKIRTIMISSVYELNTNIDCIIKIIKNVFHNINKTHIQSINIKQYNSISDKVYIGQRIDKNTLFNDKNIFIAGTYTHEYEYECSESAALSAKNAVEVLMKNL